MFLLLLLFSCEDTPIYIPDRCELQITSLSPTPLKVSEPVSLTAAPLTTHWDSLVTIDGKTTEVLDLQRLGCDECDACRQANSCHPCQDCDTCDPICKRDCSESLTFTLPEDAAAKARLQLTNAYGQSDLYEIEIETEQPLNSEDTGN